ncbi:hypothetical protein OPW41_17020 [Vibrio europaeus]|uniref:Uncharacterized protein n=1 Tax=Vibrio europaeus TaxID=300876 RepID=A0A178JE43_9VIBR|nr:hypothetical protein [Vibrio europaeus]MDC5707610.1 hypothetical protein [Vibrio europaeus]MDC5709856.1 hypothetical protein [Vibrio europaeus]MDC5716667.1 hypothetical protein [Vibrio europaeus]MDC5722712.1 hypothetical protein [Vibrio europaeus]MDC5726987.1 hypothetical protein [Vibrio europaeus]
MFRATAIRAWSKDLARQDRLDVQAFEQRMEEARLNLQEEQFNQVNKNADRTFKLQDDKFKFELEQANNPNLISSM